METQFGTKGPPLAGPDEICAWFKKTRIATLDKDRVAQLYFTFHPRTVFLKTLGLASEVVDIGAGDGSSAVFRSWPEPKREDLKIYAYSIEKGAYFDDFSGYELSDWNLSQPEFDGKCFDAILCAHFIEHIQDPVSLVRWARRKLRSGGRIYLEWPSANALSLPPRAELEALGVPLIISRFDDDGTHQALPDGDAIAEAMRDNGFRIEARGTIRLPWLEDEMLSHGKDEMDGFYRQAAFWSYTGWCQYIVGELAAETEASASVPAPKVHDASALASLPQIAMLSHSFAALQAAHADSESKVKSLEASLSETRALLAEERQRLAALEDSGSEVESLKGRLSETQRLLAAERRRGADYMESVARFERLEATLRETQDVLAAERQRAAAEFEDLRRRHEQVLGSRSWKLTKPLRSLANRLRAR